MGEFLMDDPPQLVVEFGVVEVRDEAVNARRGRRRWRLAWR
jgi:hypothetical protein